LGNKRISSVIGRHFSEDTGHSSDASAVNGTVVAAASHFVVVALVDLE
jgi:hypothetical protein